MELLECLATIAKKLELTDENILVLHSFNRALLESSVCAPHTQFSATSLNDTTSAMTPTPRLTELNLSRKASSPLRKDTCSQKGTC